jgi:hypothetical protein
MPNCSSVAHLQIEPLLAQLPNTGICGDDDPFLILTEPSPVTAPSCITDVANHLA